MKKYTKINEETEQKMLPAKNCEDYTKILAVIAKNTKFCMTEINKIIEKLEKGEPKQLKEGEKIDIEAVLDYIRSLQKLINEIDKKPDIDNEQKLIEKYNELKNIKNELVKININDILNNLLKKDYNDKDNMSYLKTFIKSIKNQIEGKTEEEVQNKIDFTSHAKYIGSLSKICLSIENEGLSEKFGNLGNAIKEYNQKLKKIVKGQSQVQGK